MGRMDEEDIPPLLPVDQMPPIRSQHDLHRHWRALMGRLGFSQRYLWLQLIDSDQRATPLLMQIEEVPERPEPGMLDNLMVALSHLVAEDHGSTIAPLVARPGPAGITAADHAWAAGLTAAARRGGIPMEPVHLATDEEVRIFAPDDLIERRSA
jgi:hypothetical protein